MTELKELLSRCKENNRQHDVFFWKGIIEGEPYDAIVKITFPKHVQSVIEGLKYDLVEKHYFFDSKQVGYSASLDHGIDTHHIPKGMADTYSSDVTLFKCRSGLFYRFTSWIKKLFRIS